MPALARASAALTLYGQELRNQAIAQDLVSEVAGPLTGSAKAESAWDRFKDGAVNRMRDVAYHARLGAASQVLVSHQALSGAVADELDAKSDWVDDPKQSIQDFRDESPGEKAMSAAENVPGGKSLKGAQHLGDAVAVGSAAGPIRRRRHHGDDSGGRGGPGGAEPYPDSPVAGGREWLGQGAGRRSKNRFPDEAEPGEILYRTGGDGSVTYYQEYGPDGRPSKRVDINPRSAPHNGIPPPHVQEYGRSRNPRTGQEYVTKGDVRPATPEEVRNL